MDDCVLGRDFMGRSDISVKFGPEFKVERVVPEQYDTSF